MAVEFMSSSRGGRGGVVINVASMGGRSLLVEEKNSLECRYPTNALCTQLQCQQIWHCRVHQKHDCECWCLDECIPFLSYPLQDCVASDGVRVNCVCPQFTDTDMVSHALVPTMSAQLQSLGMLTY